MVPLPLNKLSRIAPSIGKFLPAIGRKMKDHGIDLNPTRAAMFLAQMHHESGGFTKTSESLDYAADKVDDVFPGRISNADAWKFGRIDEKVRARTGTKLQDQPAHQNALANILYGGAWGKTHLGNTVAGDGWRFRGGGLGQLTGRDNYTAYSQWELGTDELVRNPDKVRTDVDLSVGSFVWFWMSRNLNKLADSGDVRAVTKKVNGGYNGLEDRQALFEKYVAALS
jgi:putative chitinase